MNGASETVVAAAAEDLDDLARLEAECLPDPWTRADLALYFGSDAVVGFRLVAAPRDGHALGYALFQVFPGEVELLRLAIDPAARRRGRGRRLLAAALDRLSAGGRSVCHLEVRADNAAARALYETFGFRLAGRRRGYYADGEDAVRYRFETASGVG